MDTVPHTSKDKEKILEAIGVSSFEELLTSIPKRLRDFRWDLPCGVSELELAAELRGTAVRNTDFTSAVCYLGAGNYDHFIPAVVERLAHRSEFMTSYTPYQGEASQGTLQSMYEYQTLICELTGMDASNASMYDGASGLAEAVLLALRSDGRKKILLPQTVHPEYRAVVRTYLSYVGAEVVEVPALDGAVDLAKLRELLDGDAAAVVIQQPNFFGILEDAPEAAEAARKAGAHLIACVNPLSLGILKPPGEYGADIAVGEGQPLGNAVSYGGPHFGFFAVKEPLLRKIPGRIAGMTVDNAGRRAFVLTLQAREQHIRREKATSNICTNQALCALKGAIYLALLGREGIRKLGLLNVKNARETYERLLRIRGVSEFSRKPFFNEFVLYVDRPEEKLKESFRRNGILGPLPLARFDARMRSAYLFAVTEKRTPADLDRLVKAIEETKEGDYLASTGRGIKQTHF
ncbi:MAG: aminomethyl-transferring glycine dehydrogenase subunit GcvPA [Candidatus Omnitrophica bacterium]|nr:aminomethyl-transferring glycine dehydrogenase subunit GcvPA [Candidatus Omnitrophota bacterium]